MFGSPSATCLRRWPLVAVFVFLSTVMISGIGCHNRRAAMRPVYLAPPPAVTDCPPAATITPGFEEGAIAPSPSVVTPTNPVPGNGSAPSSAVAPPADEPQLAPTTPPSSSVEPKLQPPQAWNTNRRPPTRAALRTQVASFVKDPNDLFAPPKADRPWRYVVLHHSAHAAGSYAQIDREHRQVQGWDGCGYHFVIGNGSQSPDGQIEVAQRWTDQRGGAHCRNGKNADVNEYGIGICLIGNFEESPPTPRQVEAARSLVAFLRDRYAIPSDRIDTHAHLAVGPTACPGKNFPAASILGSRNLAYRTASLGAWSTPAPEGLLQERD